MGIVAEARHGFVVAIVLMMPFVRMRSIEEMEVQRSAMIVNQDHLGPRCRREQHRERQHANEHAQPS